MAEQYVSIAVDSLIIGEPLPASIYVFIQGRFILLRADGDLVTPSLAERFRRQRMEHIFVKNSDVPHFNHWVEVNQVLMKLPAKSIPLIELRQKTIQDLRECFEVSTENGFQRQQLQKFAEHSRHIVGELLKNPLTTLPLDQLQLYSSNELEHSLNVSFLSTYVAYQIGYHHRPILEHIALGALLHDAGKTQIEIDENADDTQVIERMKEHPSIGAQIVDAEGSNLPIEVQMIVAQHHEYHDGSGYPRGLKGSMIYDLARIVSLINFYDELVRGTPGPWAHRQRRALTQLIQEYEGLFEPSKFEKAVHVLERSLDAEA